MFATLLGSLPRPPLADDAAPEALLDAVLELQVEHGLEPLTDAGWALDGEDPVAAWRATAARTDGLVKAVVDGPFTSGRPAAEVRAVLLGLAEAGCRWIEVHEPGATGIGADADERARFMDAHATLTAGFGADVHLSLAITGGSADGAGIDTLLAGAYASLALDLIDGPDNWRLATKWPADRGLICGALSTREGSDDGPELLLWAARYGASTRGRGPARVGLATAGSLAALPWAVAAEKVRRLGEAARLAAAPLDEPLAAIDPRAVDKRSAALGRYEPDADRPAGRKVWRRPRKNTVMLLAWATDRGHLGVQRVLGIFEVARTAGSLALAVQDGASRPP